MYTVESWVLVPDAIPMEVRAGDAHGRKVAEVTDRAEGALIAAAPRLLDRLKYGIQLLEQVERNDRDAGHAIAARYIEHELAHLRQVVNDVERPGVGIDFRGDSEGR